MRDQQPQCEHGDEELHARAFLGNNEQARGRIDENAARHSFDTAPPGQRGGDFRSDHLQRGNDLVAERHQHEGIGKRKGQHEPGAQAPQRQYGALQCHHRSALRDGVDRDLAAHEPDGEAQHQPCEPGPPAPQPGPRQFVAPDPPEPRNDRRDQQDMAVGVDVPPLMRHRAPFRECQRHQHERGERQHGPGYGERALARGSCGRTTEHRAARPRRPGFRSMPGPRFPSSSRRSRTCGPPVPSPRPGADRPAGP